MKNLSLKKLHSFVIFQNLKRTAPKDFPDIDEMTVTVEVILPAFEIASGAFLDFRKKSDDLGNQVGTGKMTKEEFTEKIEALQKEVRKFELAEGDQLVEVALETTAYNKFVEQLTRWGKNWFSDLTDFVAVNKAVKVAADK